MDIGGNIAKSCLVEYVFEKNGGMGRGKAQSFGFWGYTQRSTECQRSVAGGLKLPFGLSGFSRVGLTLPDV